MQCKCNVLEIVLSVVVFIVALWPGILGAMASKWVIVVAAIVLLIHAITCSRCKYCDMGKTSKTSSKKK